MISLAISSCPNDIFAFYHLIHHSQFKDKIKLTVTNINNLNKFLLEGQVDFCKVSFFTFFKQLDKYTLLKPGSAFGKNSGPLLVAKTNFNLLNSSVIAIPGEFTTANLLLSLCYPNLLNKIVIPFDKIIETVLNGDVDAGLIIHESCFTYKKFGLQCLNDLGSEWREKTDCLIPLGTIVAKKSLLKKTIDDFEQALYESIRKADNVDYQYRQELNDFIQFYAQEMEMKIIYKYIATYVNKASLKFNDNEKKAITKLFIVAQEHNLIPKFNQPFRL